MIRANQGPESFYRASKYLCIYLFSTIANFLWVLIYKFGCPVKISPQNIFSTQNTYPLKIFPLKIPQFYKNSWKIYQLYYIHLIFTYFHSFQYTIQIRPTWRISYLLKTIFIVSDLIIFKGILKNTSSAIQFQTVNIYQSHHIIRLIPRV